MKCNLRGMLLNAARFLELPPEGQEEEILGADYYAHCLREIASHVKMVQENPSRLAEFVELYCLTRASTGGEVAK